MFAISQKSMNILFHDALRDGKVTQRFILTDGTRIEVRKISKGSLFVKVASYAGYPVEDFEKMCRAWPEPLPEGVQQSKMKLMGMFCIFAHFPIRQQALVD